MLSLFRLFVFSCLTFGAVVSAGCSSAPNTRPTVTPSHGRVPLALVVTTGAKDTPAVSPDELGAMVGRAAQEFAAAGLEVNVVSVQYVSRRDADPRTRKGRRALARRAPGGAVPVAFVPYAGRRTRGKWVTRDGLVVIGSTATATTLSHELGHALGLDHHPDPSNIMCSCDRRGTPTFSGGQRQRLRVAAVSRWTPPDPSGFREPDRR